MKIEAQQTKDVIVDITAEELSLAIVKCKDISLSDVVELVRQKFLRIQMMDETMFIKDGVWYKGDQNTVYRGHEASSIEAGIYGAIEALDAVLVMDKLKGR